MKIRQRQQEVEATVVVTAKCTPPSASCRPGAGCMLYMTGDTMYKKDVYTFHAKQRTNSASYPAFSLFGAVQGCSVWTRLKAAAAEEDKKIGVSSASYLLSMVFWGVLLNGKGFFDLCAVSRFGHARGSTSSHASFFLAAGCLSAWGSSVRARLPPARLVLKRSEARPPVPWGPAWGKEAFWWFLCPSAWLRLQDTNNPTQHLPISRPCPAQVGTHGAQMLPRRAAEERQQQMKCHVVDQPGRGDPAPKVGHPTNR